MIVRIAFWMSLYCLLAPGLTAAQQAQADQPPSKRLVFSPAPEARPALRYQLIPPLLDRRPGNAAVIYNKVGIRLSGPAVHDVAIKLSSWMERPLAELPRDEIAATLTLYASVLADVRRAARRESCDWQSPLGEQVFYGMLLDEVHKVREFSRFLVVQARLQIAEGQFEQAIDTLQTGYSLARQVGSGPTMVNGLVGISISEMMSRQMEDLISQPDAPNLYWALASLPDPLVDMRFAVEAEANLLYLSYPELRNLESAGHTPEYWQAIMVRILDDLTQVRGQSNSWSGQLALTALSVKDYPEAKRYLIAKGRPSAEVEALPVAQVVAIHLLDVYLELRDDMFKWFYVPYPEALDGMNRANECLQQSSRSSSSVLATLILPSVQQVCIASIHSERSIAQLQTIEALRLHAAAHKGALPDRLEDVTLVPIPHDPSTGMPFDYERTGDSALLSSAGLSRSSPSDGRYQLTIRP